MKRAALVLLLLALACNESSPTDPDGPVGFTEVFKDRYSGVQTRRAEIIARADRFQQVWDEIMSTRTPKPPLPVVDFSESILVFTSLGNTADSCKTVEIDGINRRAGALEVSIAEVRPPANCVCPPVTVSPVHIVSVKRLATGATFSFHDATRGTCD